MEILSLGAGVQSSVVALMSEAGELPRLDAAIFADTGAEPDDVYEWLDWLEGRLSFPVYRVMQKGGLLDAEGIKRVSEKSGKRYVTTHAPYWVASGDQWGGGLLRKCTRDFKIVPVQRKVKELVAPPRGQKTPMVRQWLGISMDEAHRMKPSRIPWIAHWYPLVTDTRTSRAGCLRWFRRQGYDVAPPFSEPPRSACYMCPYHHPREWRRLQTEHPAEYEKAAAFEDRLRAAFEDHDNALKEGEVYLAKPSKNSKPRTLREIDWAEEMETGQIDLFGHWGNECEGMCGL